MGKWSQFVFNRCASSHWCASSAQVCTWKPFLHRLAQVPYPYVMTLQIICLIIHGTFVVTYVAVVLRNARVVLLAFIKKRREDKNRGIISAERKEVAVRRLYSLMSMGKFRMLRRVCSVVENRLQAAGPSPSPPPPVLAGSCGVLQQPPPPQSQTQSPRYILRHSSVVCARRSTEVQLGKRCVIHVQSGR